MTDTKNLIDSPSAQLYIQLSRSRNSLRRENIKNVKTICDQMEKDQVLITSAEVARRCMERFGSPAPSTITNVGSQLGEYVKMRRLEQRTVFKNKERMNLSISKYPNRISLNQD